MWDTLANMFVILECAQFPLSSQNSIGPSWARSWHSPSGCSGWARVLEKMCTFQHSGVTPACWGVFLKCQPPAFPGPNQGHVQLPYPGIQGNRTRISTCRWCLLGPINLTLPYWKQVSDPCLPMDHLFWHLWQSSLLDLVNSWLLMQPFLSREGKNQYFYDIVYFYSFMWLF